MPRSKGTTLLKATDNFRRLEQKVARPERAVEKTRRKSAEAEEEYFRLAAEAFASRRIPPITGQEVAASTSA